MRFETLHGELAKVSALHWRAMKKIDANHIERFTTQYTLMQSDKL